MGVTPGNTLALFFVYTFSNETFDDAIAELDTLSEKPQSTKTKHWSCNYRNIMDFRYVVHT